MKSFSILTALLLFFCVSVLGQDQIIKKKQAVISCKVKEIGMDEIKYIMPEYSPDLIFSIDKSKVMKIIFANGKEMFFKDEMLNPDNYVDNSRNAFKVDFISPLTGNTTFAFERNIRPGRSWEASLGIIGLGANVMDDAFGLFGRFGYKFIKSPDFYLRGMRYAHILKGGYIRPEIAFGSYSYRRTVYDYSGGYPYNHQLKNVNNTFASLMLNIGKQWVFDNSFLVDAYVGVGYGFDSDNYDDGYNFAMVTASDNTPLSFGAGLKVGFLFK